MKTNRPTDKDDQDRYQFVERPRCRKCGSVWLVTTRTIEKTEEVYSVRKRCLKCRHTFTVVSE